MSRSNVSSVEIEIRSTCVSRPRWSIPRARSRSSAPTLPGSRRRRASSSSAARSPIVATPGCASRSSARGPTPGSRRTSNGARKPPLCPGAHDRQPARLAPVGGDLGDDLAGGDAERAGQGVAPRTAAWTASATRRRRGSPARFRPGRGSPRRARSARPSGRPRAPSARPSASTGGRGCGAAGRTRPPGSGAAPPRSSSPSGSRTAARRSSRSRRPRGRAGRRRRRAACAAGSGPRAARRRRRTHRGRGARRSREQAYAWVPDTRCQPLLLPSEHGVCRRSGCPARLRDGRLRRRPASARPGGRHRARDRPPAARRARARPRPGEEARRRRRRPRPTSPRSATTPRSRSSPR